MPKRLLDPDLIRTLDYLAAVVRKIHLGEMQGGHWSHRPGFGLDFKDHRSYVQGDDPRRVDWNLYVRLGRLFVKVFHDEEDVDIHLVLDRSASMLFGSPTKHRYASQIAAAIAYVALTSQERIGLWTFSNGICKGSHPGRGNAHLCHVFDSLANDTAHGATGMKDALTSLVARTPRGGLYILFSDFLDCPDWEHSLKMLADRPRSELQVLHIADREECRPTTRGNTQLSALETGESISLTITDKAVEQYENKWQAHQQDAEQFCRRRNVPYLLAVTEASVNSTLIAFLKQKGMLR